MSWLRGILSWNIILNIILFSTFSAVHGCENLSKYICFHYEIYSTEEETERNKFEIHCSVYLFGLKSAILSIERNFFVLFFYPKYLNAAKVMYTLWYCFLVSTITVKSSLGKLIPFMIWFVSIVKWYWHALECYGLKISLACFSRMTPGWGIIDKLPSGWFLLLVKVLSLIPQTNSFVSLWKRHAQRVLSSENICIQFGTALFIASL